MKVLVTGASGFVGQNFRKKCKSSPHEFIFASCSAEDSQTIKVPSLYVNISSILEGLEIDCIVHLASIIPHSFADATYEAVFVPNIEMMHNLSTFAQKTSVRRFIYTSSFGSMRFPERLDIQDYYTLAKVTGEIFCAMLQQKGCSTCSLRISAPYGPYSKKETVINRFINNALTNCDLEIFGSGKREQNFTYIDDVIAAIILAIDSDVSGVYAIASEKNISMHDLAKHIVELCCSNSKLIVGKFEDIQENYRPDYDIGPASEHLKFFPKYGIKDGLKKYISWIQAKHENNSFFRCPR